MGRCPNRGCGSGECAFSGANRRDTQRAGGTDSARPPPYVVPYLFFVMTYPPLASARLAVQVVGYPIRGG